MPKGKDGSRGEKGHCEAAAKKLEIVRVGMVKNREDPLNMERWSMKARSEQDGESSHNASSTCHYLQLGLGMPVETLLTGQRSPVNHERLQVKNPVKITAYLITHLVEIGRPGVHRSIMSYWGVCGDVEARTKKLETRDISIRMFEI
ncbi:hypothetical protein BKA82DRAFT_4019057 [Pisolithus tinctorius]|nr:hypothetical protein BKA82DRAFT_4019057 [Pisolithus tinctorius]